MTRLHTTEDAAAILAVSPSFLQRGATSRTLPHTRVGRFVRFSTEDIEAIIRMGQTPPAVSPLRRRRSA